MIAHQWRQPLNTITLEISNLQIQQMMGVKIEDKVISQTLENISKTILYLSETVDDFKTYFHPDKELTTIKLLDLLHKMEGFIKGRIDSNKIDLVYVDIPDIELKIFANELIQVLLNILNNAIDAYVEHDIDNKKIEISVSLVQNNIRLKIKDYAGGIPQKNIAKLFEPYFSTKGKNGTGLGLYMSQMIIQKQFRGTISAQSAQGQSEFCIEFQKDLGE
jgi:signal transduction histidine kinase